MTSMDCRFTLSFNGEIYSFVELRSKLCGLGAKFRTESDTEVVLEACKYWGQSSLNRFRGIFVFALVDRKGRALHRVRRQARSRTAEFSQWRVRWRNRRPETD